VLFGQDNTAAGRTTDIEGEIEVEGTSVVGGKVIVDMTTVRSDQDRRDNQFHSRIMETSRFPTATFELIDPIDVGSVPAAGTQVNKTVRGKLTLHGVTKNVDVDVEARRSGTQIQVRGAVPIVFADWDIEDPSFGPARTEDHGLLEFALAFSRV
jgi:polyisoprenoid-binding protein YceI